MAISKISVFLRDTTDKLSTVLRDNGFLTVPPERESELATLLEKFNDEMYGAPSSGSPRRKQTDVRVMSETPVVYDRDYLTKQSVQELLRIAKAKGCKNLGPRKKESLVDKLLQHFTAPPLVTEADQVQSEASSQASDITGASDDELRPEPVPAAPDETKEKKPRKKKEPTDEPAPVPTGDAPAPVKKERKKKEKAEEDSQVVPTGDAPAPAVKKERKKKEKSDDESKPKAERKKKAAPAEEEKQEKEDEEENTIAVRSWIHPKEQDKPPTERTRYCIDPITNNIYNPDQLTAEPIGRWDDDAQEIIPF